MPGLPLWTGRLLREVKTGRHWERCLAVEFLLPSHWSGFSLPLGSSLWDQGLPGPVFQPVMA
jgi:hypothetical protein